MSDIKVLAWGVMTKQGLVDVSTDRDDAAESQRYAKTCPIIELVDKAALLKQSARIQELESAIREFCEIDYKHHPDDIEHMQACTKLHNLMESKND